jgi:serine/threonine-protein kinase
MVLVAGSDRVMDPDTLLLRLLAARSILTTEQNERLRSWWQTDRQPNERLLAFLVRQGVFSPNTSQRISLICHEYITTSVGVQLLPPKEVGKLRSLITEIAPVVSSPTNSSPAPKPTSSVDFGLDIPDDSESPTDRLDAKALEKAVIPRIGQRLGKYLLTENVGMGSTGIVFRAIHQTLDIPVALKVLRVGSGSVSASASMIVQQLRTEAKLLARLDHPHIVRVLDFEEVDPFPYLVLEFVEGLSLAELIQQSGRLQTDRARQIMYQMASALSAALEVGVIHRDVKPSNILLNKAGNAKLTDLGLALVTQEHDLPPGVIPRAGLAGTVAYMAPEVIRQESDVDQRADMYSLGVTFYQAVTGVVPFAGTTPQEVMYQHIQRLPVEPITLVPSLSTPVNNLIVRLLAKQPADRFASYAELIDGLLAAGDSLHTPPPLPAVLRNFRLPVPPPGPPPTVWQRWWRWWFG